MVRINFALFFLLGVFICPLNGMESPDFPMKKEQPVKLPKQPRDVEESVVHALLKESDEDFAKAVQFLYQSGADFTIHGINNITQKGLNAFHTACASKIMASKVQTLIDYGADIYKPAQICMEGNMLIDKWYPLHLAVRSENLDVIKSLLKKDAAMQEDTDPFSTAFINPLDAMLMTPLHQALANKQLDIAEFLIDNGGRSFEKDKFDNTILDYAFEAQNFKIIEKIILSMRDDEGRTWLHKAVITNSYNLIGNLLHYGKNITTIDIINVVDSYNKTSLDYALESKDNYIIKLLLTSQKDWALKDNLLRTVYSLLKNKDYPLLFELLGAAIYDKQEFYYFNNIIHSQLQEKNCDLLLIQEYINYLPVLIETCNEKIIPSIKVLACLHASVRMCLYEQFALLFQHEQLANAQQACFIIECLSNLNEPVKILGNNSIGQFLCSTPIDPAVYDLLLVTIQLGLDPLQVDQYGNSLLLLLSLNLGHSEYHETIYNMMQLLLLAGCSINVQTYTTESTALHYAVAHNVQEIIDLLKEFKADENIQDHQGNKPFDLKKS